MTSLSLRMAGVVAGREPIFPCGIALLRAQREGACAARVVQPNALMRRFTVSVLLALSLTNAAPVDALPDSRLRRSVSSPRAHRRVSLRANRGVLARINRARAGYALLFPTGAVRHVRVMRSDSHVILERPDGVLDVVRHSDANAQIQTGQNVQSAPAAEFRVGHARWIRYEAGPNGTVRVYRQLPRTAGGKIASTHALTSFALTARDALHPFGERGITVCVAIPRDLLDAAVAGSLGGAGWSGGGLGIDVFEEVQIDSKALRAAGLGEVAVPESARVVPAGGTFEIPF